MSEYVGGGSVSGAVAEVEATDSQASTKTILVLDGAELFVRFEQTILQRREWKVLGATTGGQALDLLEAGHVDLIVMNSVLPDLRGDHLVRAIRSAPACRDTGIVVVTSSANEDEADACLREGANTVLLKPVSRATLCRAAEELLCVATRRHVRLLVGLDLKVNGAQRALFGHTVNLSAGGMLVELSSDLEVGDSIDLRFQLPGDPVPVLVMARVMRAATEAAPGLWGLSFEGMTEGDRKRIDAFVASRHEAPVE